MTASDGPSPGPLDWETLRSRYILAGHVQQHRALNVLGARSWDLDLSAGTANFDGLHTRVGLLGNESHSAGTWRWGWGLMSQGGFLPGIDTVSQAAANLPGAEHVAYLHDLDVPLDEVDPWDLAMVAAGAGGGDPIYRGPHSNGALYFTLRDLQMPPISIPALVATIGQAISELYVADHRLAVTTMLTQQGYVPRPVDDATTSWAAPDGATAVIVTCDGRSRLTELTVRPAGR